MKFASFFSAPVLPTFFCPFFVLGVVIFFLVICDVLRTSLQGVGSLLIPMRVH